MQVKVLFRALATKWYCWRLGGEEIEDRMHFVELSWTLVWWVWESRCWLLFFGLVYFWISIYKFSWIEELELDFKKIENSAFLSAQFPGLQPHQSTCATCHSISFVFHRQPHSSASSMHLTKCIAQFIHNLIASRSHHRRVRPASSSTISITTPINRQIAVINFCFAFFSPVRSFCFKKNKQHEPRDRNADRIYNFPTATELKKKPSTKTELN